jgi:hypothetical protein
MNGRKPTDIISGQVGEGNIASNADGTLFASVSREQHSVERPAWMKKIVTSLVKSSEALGVDVFPDVSEHPAHM